jgi:hypothetical protein
MLTQAEWSKVTDACNLGDPNAAYSLFFDQFKISYDTAFPMTRQDGMEGVKLRQPWMTYGLIKSCKKKTKLYVNYLKKA